MPFQDLRTRIGKEDQVFCLRSGVEIISTNTVKAKLLPATHRKEN
jgi:hypothetical protein